MSDQGDAPPTQAPKPEAPDVDALVASTLQRITAGIEEGSRADARIKTLVSTIREQAVELAKAQALAPDVDGLRSSWEAEHLAPLRTQLTEAQQRIAEFDRREALSVAGIPQESWDAVGRYYRGDTIGEEQPPPLAEWLAAKKEAGDPVVVALAGKSTARPAGGPPVAAAPTGAPVSAQSVDAYREYFESAEFKALPRDQQLTKLREAMAQRKAGLRG